MPLSLPRRIAFCITDLDPGGAERALVRLAVGLKEHGWLPTVFCLSPRGRLADDLERAGIEVVCYGARRRMAAVRVLPRLIADLRRFRPALLQTWLYHANLVGRIAGRLAGVPRIVSGVRVAERRGRLRLWLDRATNRLVDRHVCVSRGVAEFSVRSGGLPQEKIVVIPNGVDVRRFADVAPVDWADVGLPPDSRVVLFVGRLDRQKRPDLLIEAASQWTRSRPDVHLLLVGEGPLREALAAEIKQRNLETHVHILGWRPDVPGLMRAASCLVLASDWEGMPNVILEAMAAGLPVVSTPVEGLAELACGEPVYELVAGGDSASIVEGVVRLLEDQTQARQTAELAQVLVAKQFTWSKMIQSYEQLYQDLLAGLS